MRQGQVGEGERVGQDRDIWQVKMHSCLSFLIKQTK